MRLSFGPVAIELHPHLGSRELALDAAVELRVPVIGFRLDTSVYAHLAPRICGHVCVVPLRLAMVEADALFVGGEIHLSR